MTKTGMEYLRGRFRRAFVLRPVLPRLGLQYRLCEVGPKRLDHQQFAMEIDALLEADDILEPSPGVFILREGDSDGLSSDIAHAEQTWTSRSRAKDEAAMDALLESILERLSGAGFSNSNLWADPMAHGKRELDWRGASRYVDLNSRTIAATLWISWHEAALLPTDTDLWGFLRHCATRDRVPLILGRAVARLAFPVLRVLGAKALQYYFVPIISASANALRELQHTADLLGLPPVRDASTWGTHAAIEALIAQLESNAAAYPLNPRGRDAIALAVNRRFDQRPVSPTMLRRWASDIEAGLKISLPLPWHRSLSHWVKRSAELDRVSRKGGSEAQ